jgi:hypothetical protein
MYVYALIADLQDRRYVSMSKVLAEASVPATAPVDSSVYITDSVTFSPMAQAIADAMIRMNAQPNRQGTVIDSTLSKKRA